MSGPDAARQGETRAGRAGIWTGLVIGPVAWTIHFVVSVGLIETVCVRGAFNNGIFSTGVFNVARPGLSEPALILLALTLGLSLVTLIAAALSFRALVRSPAGRERSFLLRSAVVLGGISTLLMLAEAVPIFFLGPCTW